VDLQLRGKRALVTGASRGIGYAIADRLGAEGADVALIARDLDKLREAEQRLSRHDGRMLAISADTAQDSSVQAMMDTLAREFGGVDILVNAAAQPAEPGGAGALAELNDELLRAEIETKVLGYLRCARAVAPHMAAGGWGRIINISGQNARQTGNLFGSIRNVAVAAMTKNLADELGRSGINVTTVHPGFTVTERTPGVIRDLAATRGITATEVENAVAAGITIGRPVTAAEVADVVTFLASPRSVAVTGDAVSAGGGVRGPIYY
jgi:NAD(P)-dependent dehydrogenase (short-subunit alcohol dehydrogenase family)